MVKISSQPPGIWSNINWSVLIFWPSSAECNQCLGTCPRFNVATDAFSFVPSQPPFFGWHQFKRQSQRPKDWFLGTMCLFVYLYFFTLSCVCLSRAAQTDLKKDKSWFGQGHVGVWRLVPVTVWRLVCPIKDLNSMWRPRTLQHYTMSRV